MEGGRSERGRSEGRRRVKKEGRREKDKEGR